MTFHKSLWFNISVNQDLEVRLATTAYPIHFAEDVWAGISAFSRQLSHEGRKTAILTDRGVWEALGGAIEHSLPSVPRLVLDSGESSKSLTSFGRVLDFLASERLGRSGVLWVIGGGVVGDLGGFAAASFLRGIAFVQVPTTLLAMVDSSVGGKTGINLAAGKNLVGAFHHPLAVFVGSASLRTLPPREFAAGMAEVIKYGILGDAALFSSLEQPPLSPASPALLPVIRRCCEMKAAVVEADERETAAEGGRALLNLGHTFGHAVEQATAYGPYLHGEAVAIGLAGAARLSQKLGLIAAADVARIEAVVAAHSLPTRLREPLRANLLLSAMRSDKKVRAGRLRFVVIRAIGDAATRSDIDEEVIADVWRELGAQ